MISDNNLPLGSCISNFGKAASLLRKFVPLFADILDVGSGSGAFLRQARSLGFSSITASDCECRTDFQPFFLFDAEKEWLFKEQSFDAVTAWNVLEHLWNPRHFFEEAHRVMKSGGVLLFSIPNYLNARNRISFFFSGEFSRYKSNELHLTAFTSATLRRAWGGLFTLEQQGYAGLHKRRMWKISVWLLRRSAFFKMLRGETIFLVLRRI
ncbi:MAG: hypothetical protein A3C08_03270 [Candidatus Taylorbacteria bacterium RIFCSPHIGHO2_02_FULL_47_18]|uniref:Methyltransferase type 11 domain-containing protein n=1 Tax=Candidatus Taylorbacteria bacterium RIFCSPLOWO2_01_FULL_48_100 TaxID=1802322 RepID=A0A1G2NCD4_9BACT|nr:MAG: hypothetical protein A3C08_03270 [Candidatus Taylorbacteria bacterium RIFCSPHIGHO2_02_FULL_47_18]OHA33758.1 MAG: hypothetical protein A2938_00420 [Candidatus Taylorbacteria bacterium RIFCSPLOWO2_01_FULL_48_100]OHA41083.1 MAG: hypothetical protein A3J31_03290 [Candidatus Taylorbacteria bacterium RIFCSPLOWO2_02_FULL_48_16]OHA45680.1 MAG: hypothetical protein A3H13_00245 [Candidatus Taylorbacteria bacterium RIFCSPLOWO2_12_FULL_48_11]